MLIQDIGQSLRNYCTTITLGGLETIDGTRGLIVPAHSVAQTKQSDISSDPTDVLIGNRRDRNPRTLSHLLGKVFKMPSTRVEGEKKILSVDAAFVKYPSPQTPGCSLKWQKDGESFCLDDTDKNDYIDRITPLTIRGRDGDTYRVVGSKEPVGGLEVTYSGASSGPGEKIGNVVGEKILTIKEERNLYSYDYYTNISLGSIGGDSDSPVYTTPDTHGNVHIVGVLVEYLFVHNSKRTLFSSWSDVVDEFNLKPISP
ncbi:MAG: hypothetical protein OXH63_20585 [Gemmatimonadetes bacterium]|nr:hypothetical protein [Gemmatimonadota bacterium]